MTERNTHNASPKHSHTHAHGMSHKHTSDDQMKPLRYGIFQPKVICVVRPCPRIDKLTPRTLSDWYWRSRLLRKKEPVVGMISGEALTPEGAGAGGSGSAPDKSTSPTNKSQSGNMPTVQAPDGFLSGWGPIYREDDPLAVGNTEANDGLWLEEIFRMMTQVRPCMNTKTPHSRRVKD